MSFVDWKRESRRFLTEVARGPLGEATWDRYEDDQCELELFRKIKLAIFGRENFLNEEHDELVEDIRKKCVDKSGWPDVVDMAIIYVCVRFKKRNVIVPVFRVRDNDFSPEDCCVIDSFGRVYKNWEDYLETNTWDVSWVIFPEAGEYNLDELGECITKLKDQSERGEFELKLDETSKVVGIASTVTSITGMVLSAIPLTAPVGVPLVITAAVFGVQPMVWGTIRGLETLIDRGKHGQTLSITNTESRRSWVQTIAGSLSIATMGMIGGFGHSPSVTVRIVCSALLNTSTSLNALAKINLVYEIAKERKEKLNPMDVFNLTSSMFLLCHTVVTQSAARRVLQRAGQHLAGDAPSEERRFQGTREHRTFRTLRVIDDADSFYDDW